MDEDAYENHVTLTAEAHAILAAKDARIATLTEALEHFANLAPGRYVVDMTGLRKVARRTLNPSIPGNTDDPDSVLHGSVIVDFRTQKIYVHAPVTDAAVLAYLAEEQWLSKPELLKDFPGRRMDDGGFELADGWSIVKVNEEKLMGMIKIEVQGSFRRHRAGKQFSAMDHGHARCVRDAIAFLIDLLPDAIRQDHELHADGHKPNGEFGRADNE